MAGEGEMNGVTLGELRRVVDKLRLDIRDDLGEIKAMLDSKVDVAVHVRDIARIEERASGARTLAMWALGALVSIVVAAITTTAVLLSQVS